MKSMLALRGLQAASTSPGGARRSQGKSHFIERASCPNHEDCVGSQLATPASRFSTSSGTSPRNCSTSSAERSDKRGQERPLSREILSEILRQSERNSFQ